MQSLPKHNAAALYAACQGKDGPMAQVDAYEALWAYLYRTTHFLIRDQPDAAARAQDYAQTTLIRIHQRLADCRQPAAFLGWARRIATHIVFDDLRRRRRLVPLDEGAWDDILAGETAVARNREVEERASERLLDEQLLTMLSQAPISDRSRRLVIGRFIDGTPDRDLAARESEIAGQSVRPSHVQVTRAKNIQKLRSYAPLLALLGHE